MKMNLPNRLTLLRILMCPFFMVVLLVSTDLWASIVGFVLFLTASITDMIDGRIARRDNLVTDFGKFLDPLADKFMIIGAMLVILYRFMSDPSTGRLICILFFLSTIAVIFRELAVTSIRLVASGSKGVVIAANQLGKIKTVTQIVCVCTCIAEPEIGTYIKFLSFLNTYRPLTIATIVVMLFFTVWSGVNYIVSGWKYLDPEK